MLCGVESVSFRNIADGAVDTNASSIFFVGENGQGKTNFLDALYTLAYGSSFRGASDYEAAAVGTKAWSLCFTDERASSRIVRWTNSVKTIRENDKIVYDRKNLIERTPAIVFCHSDMKFACGEPERRRFFFDQTASLVSADYIDTLRMYKKTLKIRNAALKTREADILDIIDVQLASCGIRLRDERRRLVTTFDTYFSLRYEHVAKLGCKVGITYHPSWREGDSVESICAQLGKLREREYILGISLSGPHRDKFVFTDERGDFSQRASTGQLRLLTLTLRIVQAEYLCSLTGKKPILLLDDVLLELDPEKKRRFMENLPAAEQCFFTFLPGEPYTNYITDNTMVYWTQNGRFTRA